MDHQKFTELVLEAEATLYHIAKSILGNDCDCADAVQEAILKAFGNLHKLKKEQYFKTWLCRILINECYRMYHDRKRQITFESYMESVHPAEQTEDRELYTAIMNLEENLRLVIVLYYFEGFQTAEVAKILKIPRGTVKSRLSRARKALRTAMEEQEAYVNEIG